MMLLMHTAMTLEQTFTRPLQTWRDIPRTQAKTINLGLFYGMGKAKLQAELGVNKRESCRFI